MIQKLPLDPRRYGPLAEAAIDVQSGQAASIEPLE